MEADHHLVERFRHAVTTLKLLEPTQLGALENRLAADPALSPVIALLESGYCDHQEIELVELLMAGQTAIAGYELIDLLGRGGMGVVWKAKQISLDRIVALKTISHRAFNDQKLAARFEREATAAAKLSHPNIVAAVDFGRSGRRLFLAMEYVAGEDLGEYIERHGMLAEVAACNLIRQVASGLAHASRHGIIHRDLKPANIMLVHDEDWMASSGGAPLAKITDFGLALLNVADQEPEERLTSHQAAVGSPHYMAPEQLNGSPVDTRTDIYALGATLFHMLLGRAPWRTKSLNRIIHDKMAGDFPVEELASANISAPAQALVASMTSLDPRHRPSNCQELIAEIDRTIQQIAAQVTTTETFSWNRPSREGSESSPFSYSPANLLGQTQPLERPIDHQIAQSRLSNPVVSEIGSAERDVAKRDLAVKRLSRRTVITGASTGIGLGLIFGWYAWGRRPPEPIELVATGMPQSLFDGKTIPVTGIGEGGLGSVDGRILMTGPAMSSLGFRLPAWQYFKLDVILEVPADAILDVAMGGGIASKREPCACIRFEDGAVHGGKLAKLDGEFAASGQRIKLKTERQQHYLEVEKNQGLWLIRLYRNFELQIILPFTAPPSESQEIVFVAHPTGASEDREPTQYIALSELAVIEMQPATKAMEGARE